MSSIPKRRKLDPSQSKVQFLVHRCDEANAISNDWYSFEVDRDILTRNEVLSRSVQGLSNDEILEIRHVSGAAFESFIGFVASGHVVMTPDTVDDLLKLGRDYDEPMCVQECERFLMDEVIGFDARQRHSDPMNGVPKRVIVRTLKSDLTHLPQFNRIINTLGFDGKKHFMIKDAHADALVSLIGYGYLYRERYISTGILNVTSETVDDLIGLGREFDVAGCVTECERFLADEIVTFVVKRREPDANSGAEFETIQTNKANLVHNSVFRCMLSSRWNRPTHKIHDVFSDTFKLMLRFLCGHPIGLHPDMAHELLYQFHLYDCDDGVTQCAEYLGTLLRCSNAIDTLEVGFQLNVPALINTATLFIMENTYEVIMGQPFVECSNDTLTHIAKQKHLNVNEALFAEKVLERAAILLERDAMNDTTTLTDELVEQYTGVTIQSFHMKDVQPIEMFRLMRAYPSVFGEFDEIYERIHGTASSDTRLINGFTPCVRKFDGGVMPEYHLDRSTVTLDEEDIGSELSIDPAYRFEDTNFTVVDGSVVLLGFRFKEFDDDEIRHTNISIRKHDTQHNTTKVLMDEHYDIGPEATEIWLDRPILVHRNQPYRLCIGPISRICFEMADDLANTVTCAELGITMNFSSSSSLIDRFIVADPVTV